MLFSHLTRPNLLRLTALSSFAALSSGCHHPAAPAEPPPPPVTVAAVEQRELVEWSEFTGRTEAVEMVEVRPRVSGHIKEVRFQSGQLVEQGEVLFVIDARWHQAAVDQAQAEYEMAKVRLESAEREAARTATLLEGKAISAEEAEQRQARFSEARAAVLATEGARTTAQLDLEHTEVRAPIQGRISRALITAGNYVSGMPGSANLLTTLVSVDPIYVYADVDENSLLKFNGLLRDKKLPTNGEAKVPVELQLADEQSFVHRGYVESFDNRLDMLSGSILMRAQFSNPEGRILPGLFARIRLPLSAKAPVLLVEETAIATDQAQKYVLTLTSTNTAAYRPVQVGPLLDGKRVIREGLTAADKVIVNGLARVRPGMPVSPQETEPPGTVVERQTAQR